MLAPPCLRVGSLDDTIIATSSFGSRERRTPHSHRIYTAFTPHSHNTRTRTAHTLAHTHYTHTTLRSKMAKPQSILPPDFKEMVRNFEPIRLGDAKEFASNLTPDQQKHPCCACFKIYCTSVSKCCPKKCCSLSCNILCPCCLWYCIPWLCACKDTKNPGEFSCTDLKGNRYELVKVDAEYETWAFFSENIYLNPKGSDLKASLYCKK